MREKKLHCKEHTGCRFDSQASNGSSHSALTPVSVDMIPYFDLLVTGHASGEHAIYIIYEEMLLD